MRKRTVSRALAMRGRQSFPRTRRFCPRLGRREMLFLCGGIAPCGATGSRDLPDAYNLIGLLRKVRRLHGLLASIREARNPIFILVSVSPAVKYLVIRRNEKIARFFQNSRSSKISLISTSLILRSPFVISEVRRSISLALRRSFGGLFEGLRTGSQNDRRSTG